MDTTVQAVIEELNERARREQEAMEQRRTLPTVERMLPIGPETGALLNLLIKATRARYVLELGTSVGYSTVWLAEAARATGGRVSTIELEPQKVAQARDYVARAGLTEQVDFRQGDILEILPTLPEGIEFVLLDCWKDIYVRCFELFAPKLAPGALVAADNILRPVAAAPEIQAYVDHVRAVPGFESTLVPAGSGIELTWKQV